jgi:hypothetical protein
VNAFHVIGSLFAVWAVTLAPLGVTRENFPRGRRQTLAVGTVSVLLAASAIGSAIITARSRKRKRPDSRPPKSAAERR